MSALHNPPVLKAVEEGEQAVGRAVASGFDVEGPGSVQGSLFDRQVAVNIGPDGGVDLLVAKP